MSNEVGNVGATVLGWGFALLLGAVACLLLIVLGGWDFSPAAFVGLLIAVLIGVIITWAARPLPNFAQIEARRHHAAASGHHKPAAAAAAEAPVAAAVAAPVMAVPETRPVAADGRPELLTAPRNGKPDDLKEIKGVGPKLEAMLHRMGVYHFDQIASWRPPEVAWVDENLEAFKGRVSRDDWVSQAKVLAAGGTTEHSRAVAQGEST